jgi:hypothetical protein
VQGDTPQHIRRREFLTENPWTLAKLIVYRVQHRVEISLRPGSHDEASAARLQRAARG